MVLNVRIRLQNYQNFIKEMVQEPTVTSPTVESVGAKRKPPRAEPGCSRAPNELKTVCTESRRLNWTNQTSGSGTEEDNYFAFRNRRLKI